MGRACRWASGRSKANPIPRRVSLCFYYEVDTRLDIMFRFDESHRRCMRRNIEARISTGEGRTSLSCWTDNRYCETLLPCTCNYAGRQITTYNNTQTPTAKPSQAAQHAAVTKHTPCPLVERLHGSRIFEQSNHVVHVRRDYISEWRASLSQDIAHRFVDRRNIKTTSEKITAPNFRPVPSCDANTIPLGGKLEA